MPKDLAALLLEDGAAPADAVARALERQREKGGALDTALLEQGALREDVLVQYLARAAEVPPAPETAWSAADARARRVFPSRVAERHGLAPFALDGRELSLVATYPVDLGLLDEISFMLSLHLTAHVGTEWRVRHLIHRLYGSPLPARLAALAAARGGTEAEPAATESTPRVKDLPAPEVPPERPEPSGFSRDEAEPLEPLAAALQQALESVDISVLDDEPEPALGASGAAGTEPEQERERPPPDRSAPPRWRLEDARAALDAARNRDEVVLAAIRYARDFFEYAAMFAVTRDAVAGHDAIGLEDERDRARAVAIWVSDPGIFKTVIETRSPFLGPVSHEASGNEAILSGLGRGTPRTALVYPVLLRDRPVCVLYADNGEAPVSARRLGSLLLQLSAVGSAFERIIRARKKRRKAPATAAPPAPPPAEVDVEVDVEEPAPEPAEPCEPSPPSVVAPSTSPRAAPAPPHADDLPRSAPPHPAPSPSQSGGEGRGEGAAESLDALEERFFHAGESSDAGAPAAVLPSAPADPPAAPAPPPSAPAATPVAPPPPAEPLTLAALADHAIDADPAVSGAASAALGERRREAGMRQATEKLRRVLLSGISARATRAARALGAIRDVEAIPLLIQVLETSERETAASAADALAAITLQRLGPDARAWLGWWKKNRGRGRAEWLFSGLTSGDRDTRVAAAVELSAAAPSPVAYSADLPPAEREQAARSWAGWWARSGHVL